MQNNDRTTATANDCPQCSRPSTTKVNGCSVCAEWPECERELGPITHDPRLVASDEERLAALREQRDRFKAERDEARAELEYRRQSMDQWWEDHKRITDRMRDELATVMGRTKDAEAKAAEMATIVIAAVMCVKGGWREDDCQALERIVEAVDKRLEHDPRPPIADDPQENPTS